MTYRKKLIEVAMPLDMIRREPVRHGHPSTIHLWWARRPLVACRAIVFATLVDDPSNDLPPSEAEKERQRLFDIMEQLLKWENSNNETVLEAARREIVKSTKGNPPPVLDPMCGGGPIPLEAQRLGLEVYASDLNPMAVLITKALIEIPPKFMGRPPINPEAKKDTGREAEWKGTSGMAADVRYYGKWVREEAWKRIGHLYPKGQRSETTVAWLWARTVRCPNPACGALMPLVRSFWLSKGKGKEAWLRPQVDHSERTVHLEVRTGSPPNLQAVNLGSTVVNEKGKRTKATFRCLVCGEGIAKGDYIDREANAGRMKTMPLAKVVTGTSGRSYLPIEQQEVGELTSHLSPYQTDTDFWEQLPKQECLGTFASNAQGRRYGFKVFTDYFTTRQLVAISTFADLILQVRVAGLADFQQDEGYANAVTTYLGLALDNCVNDWSSLASWDARGHLRSTFARQGLAMAWDFTEANPLSTKDGDWLLAVDKVAAVLESLPNKPQNGHTFQLDVSQVLPSVELPVIITDPPYYNNVSYSDLADFFYIWLRKVLAPIYPDLFSTLLTPKTDELIANHYRFNGDKKKAFDHFEVGLRKAFSLIRQQAHPDYPFTLYYAFKQEEEAAYGAVSGRIQVSTGWETMLQGLLVSGFQITGTWPVRTELGGRTVEIGANALASSIVIACRPRPEDAAIATRREFLATLRKELPQELKVLMNSHIAPVDLAQAAIGPGMAVFSRYSKVLEADGSTMTVRTALQEINYFLYDFLAQQEGDLDPESQFCIIWFEQFGVKDSPYGEADNLARAKNIGVDNLVRLGLVDASRGKVRLTLRGDYEDGWDPQTQSRLTAWEACQRLVWTLNENGEQDAGRLARRLGGLADQARELAYRLYGIADRKGWAEEALGYNALVASWPEVQKAAAAAAEETQGRIM